MTNSQNYRIEFSEDICEEYKEKFKKIISPHGTKIMEEKRSFSENILDLILHEKSNRNLAILLISEVNSSFFKEYDNFRWDKQIVKLAISKDPTLFYGISEELKIDVSIWYATIESMLREWRNFKEIDEFIEKYYPKNKVKCFDYYNNLLLKADKFYTNDISKNAISLKASNPELFDKLIYLKILDNSKKKISINPDFIKNVVNTLFENKSYVSKNQTEKEKSKQELLLDIFWKNLKELDEYELSIFESILKLIFVNEAKYLTKNKVIVEEDDEQLDKKDESNEEQIKKESKQESDDFEDFWNFCYPECEIRFYSWGYSVNTISWKSIFISASDAEKFTTDAFKNFIEFYNTLYSIWLNFIWDKYSLDFKTICNNKVWFNYLNWEWITQWKTLQILNIIWKNIWVPEDEILNEKWEKTGEYKCFDNLEQAKLLFRKINSTWKIKDKEFSNKSAFWNTAVENKLINDDLIDTKKGILNINKWK